MSDTIWECKRTPLKKWITGFAMCHHSQLCQQPGDETQIFSWAGQCKSPKIVVQKLPIIEFLLQFILVPFNFIGPSICFLATIVTQKEIWSSVNRQLIWICTNVTTSCGDNEKDIDNNILELMKKKDNQGLGTNPRSKKSKTAPHWSVEVEAFPMEVEKTLLSKTDNYFMSDKNAKTRDLEIIQMKKILKNSTKVAIPTDETNSFRTVEMTKCVKWMNEHLNLNAIKKSSRDKLKISLTTPMNF